MNVPCNCRWVFRTGISACLLLASTCAAADVDIVFASDFQNSQPIQWVRRHPAAGGASIALGPAFVTASRLSGGGTYLTLYLEVPQGLNGNTDYPLWSALKTFGLASGGMPAIGDCVSVEGTIALFNGATELTDAIWTGSPGACGELPIVPYASIAVADVATDGDSVTTGNQPGPKAEALESVLLQLPQVTVLTSNGGAGGFQIGDSVSGPNAYVLVSQFIYQYTAVQSTALTSVTGVLDQFNTMSATVYQLLPRSAADIVE